MEVALFWKVLWTVEAAGGQLPLLNMAGGSPVPGNQVREPGPGANPRNGSLFRLRGPRAPGWGQVSLSTRLQSDSSPPKCKELDLMPVGSNFHLKVALQPVAERMV